MLLNRIPGSKFPQQVATGDPLLDRYLIALDTSLAGSAAIRVLTLVEIRDSLVEHKSLAIARGLPAEEASRLAIEAVGPIEAFASEQRTTLQKKFWRMTRVGPAFAAMMAMIGYLNGIRVHSVGQFAFLFAFQAIFFGFFFAWYMAYAVPERRLPTVPANATTFSVEHARTVRWYGGIMMLFFLYGVVCCIASLYGADLGGFNIFGALHSRALGMLLLAALCVIDVLMLYIFSLRIHVDGAGFTLQRYFSKKRVEWRQLKSMRALGERYSWAPRYWKHVKIVNYAGGSSDSNSFILMQDAFNADLFAIRVREHLPGA